MEAKDTVKPVENHSFYCPHCGREFDIKDRALKEREVQAEISFKAGIREVLEAIHYEPDSYAFYVRAEEWQAKLKEWRIEDEPAN